MRRVGVAGAAALAAGGVSLLAKLAVILITDGEVTDTGAASFFLLLGVALLVVGCAALGFWLARRWHPAVRIVAAAAAVGLFFVAFSLLDSLGKTFVERGSYWRDEMGILLTAVLALALALPAASRLRA